MGKIRIFENFFSKIQIFIKIFSNIWIFHNNFFRYHHRKIANFWKNFLRFFSEFYFRRFREKIFWKSAKNRPQNFCVRPFSQNPPGWDPDFPTQEAFLDKLLNGRRVSTVPRFSFSLPLRVLRSFKDPPYFLAYGSPIFRIGLSTDFDSTCIKVTKNHYPHFF